MKKYFVISFALFAALVACNKDEIVPENNEAPAASFTATIAPDTKITFTPDGNTPEGFNTAFDGNEKVFLWTVGATGDKYTRFNSSSHADKQSTFTIDANAQYVNAPSSTPVDFGAYLVSYNCVGTLDNAPYLRFGYNDANNFKHRFNFTVGNGTLAQATKVQFLYATDNYDGSAYPDLAFEYLTSILKVDVNLPSGSGATTSNTKIYVKGTGLVTQAQLNSTTGAIKTDESGATPTFTVTPTDGIIDGDHIVFYVPIWTGLSGVTIKDASVDIDVDGLIYSTVLANSTGKAVAPGKVYTFKPVAKLALKNVDKWVNDAAGSVTIAAGLTESASEGLTYNSATGEVSWAANASGRPVKKTISFDSGETVAITQISVDDFKGTYSFRTQRFSNNTKVTTAASDVTFDITITDPLVGETVEDYDGTIYTNNLGLRGLYLDAVADAVLDLDYFDRTVSFGLFLDERKAQPVANGNATYPYVCFIPEGGTTWNATTMAAPWKFVPIPISATQNYQWLWFKVSSDFNVLNYDYGNKQVMIGTDGSAGTTIIGITCAIARNASPAAADIYTTYNVIYQANPNKRMDTGGFTITRK